MSIEKIIESEEFKKEILSAIEGGKWTDYFYNGEDEVPVNAFNSEAALNNVLGVIKELLNKANH